jgi:hypothetical protein
MYRSNARAGGGGGRRVSKFDDVVCYVVETRAREREMRDDA